MQNLTIKPTFFFRAQPLDSSAGKKVLTLLAEQKILETDVERTNEEGKDLIKRKPLQMDMTVLDVASVVVPDTLNPVQIAYLQQLVNKHIEDLQRPEVEAVTGKVIDWTTVFNTEFARKEAAIKVTAEERKAAAAALSQILVNIAKPNAVDIIKGLIETGFSATSLVKFASKPAVLQALQAKLVEAVELLATNSPEEFEKHTNAINQCLTNLDKVLAPTELGADDFA